MKSGRKRHHPRSDICLFLTIFVRPENYGIAVFSIDMEPKSAMSPSVPDAGRAIGRHAGKGRWIDGRHAD